MISTIPTLAGGVKPFWQSQAFMLHWTVNMAGKPKVLCYMQHTGSKLHFRIEWSSPSSVACYMCYSSRWWPILKVLKQCAALLFSFWWLSCCHVMFISAFWFTDNNDFLDNGRSKKSIIIWIDIAMIWCGMAGLATEQERKDRISIQVVLSQSCCAAFHNPAIPSQSWCAAVLHVLLHQSIGGIILSHSTQNRVWCWLLWLHTSWWSHKFLVQPCAPSGVDCTNDITMCLVHWWHWRDEQAFKPGGLAASGANCSLH